jgi:hypothetical protein
MKCFTYAEARLILIDLRSIPIKDSIIEVQELRIQNFGEQVDNLEQQNDLRDGRIEMFEKRARRNKWAMIGAGILGLAVGVVFGGL